MYSMAEVLKIRKNADIQKNAYGGKASVVYTESIDFEEDDSAPESDGNAKKKPDKSPEPEVITKEPINRYQDHFMGGPLGCDPKKSASNSKGSGSPKEKFEEKAKSEPEKNFASERDFFCCS